MSDIAIRVENLSKQYRIGRRQRYKTVRESIRGTLSRSVKRLSGNPRDDADRSFWALKDINFEVQSGEVVGIIGRNGAGKSTLLKVLSQITEPTSGRIEINGRIGSLLEVGTGFHPELTGRENVYLNGSILGMRRHEIAAKFDEIVTFAGVEQFLDTPVKHYSSGMYTRLAFAVAAHLEPEILVVDEVLAVGDAEFQKKCLGRMSEVAREGRTVLFVSHNMAAINNLCSRTIVLSSGSIAFDGACVEGVAAYLESFKADSVADLRSRTDRSGAGNVRFVGARLQNAEGGNVDEGMSGETLSIALDYKSSKDDSLKNARASIAFEDRIGQVLFLCSTELTSSSSMDIPPSGTLRCIVPKLPLSGGDYFMTLFLEVSGDVQDHLQSAIPFHVEDGDFYGTGKLYPAGWGGKGVLVPHYWAAPLETL